MEAQSLGSHQHSWWFSCFSLREKLARSHNKKTVLNGLFFHELENKRASYGPVDHFFFAYRNKRGLFSTICQVHQGI
ncbi:hypothetical protein [Streptococcus suis]|uniref:hypothetical protein n=1 Tax=Streptococcus suis TaxID=1307 RepID=UPI0012E9FD50|nr:hypothetical protein [Streptococcus suis]MDW8640433.1 hypothetical protein [Streptococcus suis]